MAGLAECGQKGQSMAANSKNIYEEIPDSMWELLRSVVNRNTRHLTILMGEGFEDLSSQRQLDLFLVAVYNITSPLELIKTIGLLAKQVKYGETLNMVNDIIGGMSLEK